MKIEIEAKEVERVPVGAYIARDGKICSILLQPSQHHLLEGIKSFCLSHNNKINVYDHQHTFEESLQRDVGLKPIYPGDKITLEF